MKIVELTIKWSSIDKNIKYSYLCKYKILQIIWIIFYWYILLKMLKLLIGQSNIFRTYMVHICIYVNFFTYLNENDTHIHDHAISCYHNLPLISRTQCNRRPSSLLTILSRSRLVVHSSFCAYYSLNVHGNLFTSVVVVFSSISFSIIWKMQTIIITWKWISSYTWELGLLIRSDLCVAIYIYAYI